jgi:uncharacterized membrane protein
MLQILIALSSWLHALSTVVFIGYFLLLSLILLPVLAENHGMILSDISKRSRPWMYISLLVFIVTGVILTFANPNYLGLAQFGNLWAILMLVKHVLVLGMIVIGFWFNAIRRVGPQMGSSRGAAQAISRFRSYVNLMAICGLLVLFLTALAQVQ